MFCRAFKENIGFYVELQRSGFLPMLIQYCLDWFWPCIWAPKKKTSVLSTFGSARTETNWFSLVWSSPRLREFVLFWLKSTGAAVYLPLHTFFSDKHQARDLAPPKQHIWIFLNKRSNCIHRNLKHYVRWQELLSKMSTETHYSARDRKVFLKAAHVFSQRKSSTECHKWKDQPRTGKLFSRKVQNVRNARHEFLQMKGSNLTHSCSTPRQHQIPSNPGSKLQET
jgi:hypothetical protein